MICACGFQKLIKLETSGRFLSNNFFFLENDNYDTSSSNPKTSFLGNILFNGSLVSVNANYGCFMSVTAQGKPAEIPQNTKVMRKKKDILFILFPLSSSFLYAV